MARRDYVRRRPDGGGIVVHWDSRACVFSHVCVRVLPDVFDVEAHPWVQPDNASEDDVIEAVGLCRSAALAVSTFEPGEEPPLQAPPTSSRPRPEIPRQPGIPVPRG